MKYNPPLWVKAGEHGWIDMNKEDVEFLDISEDPFGRDEYTFEYKGKTYQSIAVTGSQPG